MSFWNWMGWTIMFVLIANLTYSLFYQRRVYVAMALKAYEDPETGQIHNTPINPIAEHLANRYLRNLTVLQGARVLAILILGFFLVR